MLTASVTSLWGLLSQWTFKLDLEGCCILFTQLWEAVGGVCETETKELGVDMMLHELHTERFSHLFFFP